MIINNSITPPTTPPIIAPLSELLLLLFGAPIDIHIYIHATSSICSCTHTKHYHSVIQLCMLTELYVTM